MGSLRELGKGKDNNKPELSAPPPEPGKIYDIGSREALLIEDHVYKVLCKRVKEMLTTEHIMEFFRLKQLLVDESEVSLVALRTEHCAFPWALRGDDLYAFLMKMIDDEQIDEYEPGGSGEFFGLPHAFDNVKFGYVEGYMYLAIPKNGAPVTKGEIIEWTVNHRIDVSHDEIDAALQNLMVLGIIDGMGDMFAFAH
jgi:hypothetical protein